jgi:ring-1,2-phenylacetyl-CoA epoxidase subunit PaaD
MDHRLDHRAGAATVGSRRHRSPPATAPTGGLTAVELPVACPRCGSRRTRLVSAFGSTACKAAHVCDACREPFDAFKAL